MTKLYYEIGYFCANIYYEVVPTIEHFCSKILKKKEQPHESIMDLMQILLSYVNIVEIRNGFTCHGNGNDNSMDFQFSRSAQALTIRICIYTLEVVDNLVSFE